MINADVIVNPCLTKQEQNSVSCTGPASARDAARVVLEHVHGMHLYEAGCVSLVSGACPRELSLTAKDEFCFLPREPFLPLGSQPCRVGSCNWQNENLRMKAPGQKL